MSRTPASLLERLKLAENQDAWRRFVQLYAPMIYRWASQAGLGSNEAADLVQDVFLILIEKLREFNYDGQRSFRAWLKTVTLNKWREQARRRMPAPTVTADGNLPDAESPNLADLFEENEYRRCLVHRAMQVVQADFEPATWKAWQEFVVEGRPAKEVAAELGLSVNAVYLAKGRVLARLREELSGLME
jgi:RNA polymerase sigma-70 factor (ECF subfamily)